MLSTEFLVAALVVVLIPGTGVLYTVATGISRGWSSSIAAAFGCTLGIVPAVLAAFVGLSAIIHAGAIAFSVLKYAGAAFLIYLAWQTWNNRGPLNFSKDAPSSTIKIAATGALINFLNPKLSIFFLAFLPQFIDITLPVQQQLAVLSVTFMLMTFLVFVVYGALAASAAHYLRRPNVTNWIRRSSALAFAFLGVRLAFEKG